MNKKVKQTLLKEVAKASKAVAWGGGGLPTLYGFYEADIPEKIQNKKQIKK